MIKSKLQITSIKQILGLSSALVLLFVYQFTSAQWTNPPAGTVPPANNTPTPINVGTSPQSKLGNLGAIELIASDYVKAGLQMWSPEYCDENGVNCWDPSTGAPGADVNLFQILRARGYGVPVAPQGYSEWPRYLICISNLVTPNEVVLLSQSSYLPNPNVVRYHSEEGSRQYSFNADGSYQSRAQMISNCSATATGSDLKSICDSGACIF